MLYRNDIDNTEDLAKVTVMDTGSVMVGTEVMDLTVGMVGGRGDITEVPQAVSEVPQVVLEVVLPTQMLVHKVSDEVA